MTGWRWIVVSTVIGLVAARVDAQTVTLSGSVVGSTPSRLGYNSGHFVAGSNTVSWWKYAGVNGARIFSSPVNVTPASDFPTTASSQADFTAKRTAVRANPLATTFIDWADIENRFVTSPTAGNNTIALASTGTALRSIGVSPVIVMTRSLANYAWPADASADASSDWQSRWLGWQQWYAQAFYWARHHDGVKFQLYNEPDLHAGTLTQAQWIEMVRYGSDAVHAAIADVNRLFGKSLVADVYGPVTTSPKLDSGNWGATLLGSRNDQLHPAEDPARALIQHFDYHNYGSSPTTFGTRVSDTIATIDSLTGGESARFPVSISEFNTRTSANYDPNDPVANPNGYTPDSLAMSSRLGQIVVNLANNKPDELYLFKFSDAGGANNGVHWQSDTGSFDVGGATKSANVYRLFTEGFTDANLLAVPTTSDADISLAASRNPSTGTRYLMAANADTTNSHALTLNLTPWGVAVGTRVTVEQVSDRYVGNVSQVIDVGPDRTITVNTDAGGVVLVKMPANHGATRTVIPVSQDAHVRHANRTTNYGAATDLIVQSGSGSGSRYVSYLQFPLTGVDTQNLTEAMLGVYGRDPGATGDTAAGIICHVYGLASGTINEASVTWSNAPNVDNSAFTGITGLIDDTYTTGVGTTADIIGQITATGTEKLISLDVSSWVRERIAAGATSVTFMITRDFRFDGDIDSSHSLVMRSSEYSDIALAPTLTVTVVPEPTTVVLVAIGIGIWVCRRPTIPAHLSRSNPAARATISRGGSRWRRPRRSQAETASTPPAAARSRTSGRVLSLRARSRRRSRPLSSP